MKNGWYLKRQKRKEVDKVPLTLLKEGESAVIQRVQGAGETKKFLENLGFVPGEEVTVISSNGGDIIVQVKGSRVAISKGIANKIMV
ncbi:FeoA family protein [Suipraeoptans intestinalis]|uniref:Ferrous iron transport protein A n=1 Tax=Suipraeoptans intestinalis TaxID=2606628 RepID=A0A6N7V1J6_9FIRM|nr:FeoA family protein [Suipraeoptans intestinalis]MDD7770846.1 FeoA family protein [Suipraeoptans intestinalis]MDY3122488.1 FeoA family protein [Suipraeoptans intestinalis]MSR93726.1 ferrous iron transport protein A [Suipraeoptans intestinalis]